MTHLDMSCSTIPKTVVNSSCLEYLQVRPSSVTCYQKCSSFLERDVPVILEFISAACSPPWYLGVTDFANLEKEEQEYQNTKADGERDN